MKDFMSINEFSDYLNLHPNTVRKAIKKGRLSAFKVGAGKNAKFLIPRSETHRMAIMDLEIVVKNMAEDMVKEQRKGV
jgi:excisionase family DNA binding protein